MAQTLTKETMLETFYPVGSIYITTKQSVNPNTTFGGSWVLIEDGRFLEATTQADGGTKVEPGLPNITGSIHSWARVFAHSGAFWQERDWDNGNNGWSGGGNHTIDFSAAKSNPIYGNSNTVQPASIKCYVWHRVS